MATVLDELVAIIGIDVDKQKLQNANNSLKQISANFIGIKTAVLAASAVIYEFERRLIKSSATIFQTSKNLNFNAQELQTLQYAAEKAGVPIDSITGAISKLNDEISNAATGNPSQGFLNALGKLSTLSKEKIDFDPFKDTGESLFNKTLGAFKKIKDSPQILSISKDLLGFNIKPILRTLDAAGKELKQDHTLLSDKQLKKADDANQSFIRLAKNVQNAAQELAIDLSPAFSALTKVVIDVTSAFKKYHSFLEAVGKKAGGAINFAEKAVSGGVNALGRLGAGLAHVTYDPGYYFKNFQKYIHSTAAAQITDAAQYKADRFNSLLSNPDIPRYLLNKNQDPIRQSIENNNSRTNNMTINNTFMPSNMSAIYTIGGNI